MRKIELWFHNGTGPWADRTDKVITIVSGLTHVEAKFENGWSWSSTQKGKEENGVRWKKIGYSHPERWVKVTLLVTDEEYDQIVMRCEMLAAMGIKYDMRGAIGCAITGRNDITAFFCSEAVYYGVLGQWLPEILNYKMHPDRLYEIACVVADRLADRFILGDDDVDNR
jgi:hypothetical protein